MIVRDLFQRVGTEQPFHLRLEGLGKEPVDVVVAVVDKYKSSVAHIAFEILSFLRRELNKLVAAEVTKRTAKDLRTAEWHDVLLCIDRQCGILDERVQYIHRHALIHIPVA